MGLKLNHTNNVANQKSNASSESNWSELFNLTKSIILFLGIAFLLRASVVEAFKIPSSSMEPTLQIGDHILVNKLSYGFRLPLIKKTLYNYSEPDRSDVVVFTRPDNPLTPEEDESDTNIIKRVIGLPGDKIEVIGSAVLINDKPLNESAYTVWWEHGGRKAFPPTYVPEGSVFLMGDNRDSSRDSRYWDNAFLPVNRIKGRAFIIYWNSLFQFKRMFNVIR